MQGVGFRYTVETAALELALTGWVRNRPDGRVEAVVEGPAARLQAFLEQVRTGPMARYIQGADAAWGEATGECDDFQIRFY